MIILCCKCLSKAYQYRVKNGFTICKTFSIIQPSCISSDTNLIMIARGIRLSETIINFALQQTGEIDP